MRTTRTRTTLSLAAAGLAAAAAVAGLPAATASPALDHGASPGADQLVQRSVAPEAAAALGGRAGALEHAVWTDAMSEHAEAARTAPDAAVRAFAAQGREVVVDVRSAQGDWARGVAYVEAPTDEHAAPVGWIYVAHHDGTGWDVGLEGEPEFADLVATSPLVAPAEKQTMAAFAERRTTERSTEPRADALAATGLLLPWQPDSYMTMAGGPHAWDAGSGPWSSMDFSAGNAGGQVRSAGSGTATSMCAGGGGWTRVIHPNGFSTDYYHMFNAVSFDGTEVGASTYLGDIGTDLCAGGSANGPHVHFALRTYDADYNGTYISLNGVSMGGWTFYEGAAQYGGSAERNGVTAVPGDAIYNRTG